MQCTLAWTPGLPTPDQVVIEQCRNTSQCPLVPVATLPGTALQVVLGDLHPQHSYCWRVQPWRGGQVLPVSNIVCN